MIYMTKEKYINPYTDFGFKKLFGTEMNKDLLISFLNALFNNSEKEIEDIQYLNSENLGDGSGDRRSVFDVYCTTRDGSRFIVEMQKAEQAFFKDRSV
ncbi:MAG: PD-(D/E)XK nuclease family transposase, partial [Bacteroidales bacterium]|nr:PD-(D/E)XK nuclease family transposase [Bacteroidales bacterium]